MNNSSWKVFVLTLLALAPLACSGSDTSDDDGGVGGTGVTLSVTVPQTDALAALATATLTLTDSAGNTLVIESAELVLRKIEFHRADEAVDCDESGGEDSCEEFEVGPVLISLPLAAGDVTTPLTTAIAPGTYDEIELEIHKPEIGSGDDADFLARHPDFVGVSIRVGGTYNDTPFEFTSDLDIEQELAFTPPIEILEGTPMNVTLAVDVSTWFRDPADDTLVDPDAANDGGDAEQLVEDNIETSFESFEDRDEDGIDDEDDPSVGD